MADPQKAATAVSAVSNGNGLETVTLGLGSRYQYLEPGQPSQANARPRGLLPVPAPVAAFVAAEEVRVLRQHGIQLTEDANRRMLNDATLDAYYPTSGSVTGRRLRAWRCLPLVSMKSTGFPSSQSATTRPLSVQGRC